MADGGEGFTGKRLKDLEVQDLVNPVRREYLFKPPGSIGSTLASWCVNEDDHVMAFSLFNVFVTVIPSAVTLFVFPWEATFGVHSTKAFVTACIVHNVMVFGLWGLRFILTLHYSAHRHCFKIGDGESFLSSTVTAVANGIAPVVLSPFFGIPSGSYYLHHVIMHHIENNVLPYDVSSTQAYQRDNFFHFLQYWLRYVLAVLFELPYYAFIRRRWSVLVHFLCVVSAYFVFASQLYAVNPAATIAILGIPYFLASFLLMFGNFSQHIFVDPDRHNNSYALTFNLIDSPENKFAYNDGYHVIHHVNSRLHWSKMPAEFMRTLDTHAKQDAFAFYGLCFNDVGFLVMTGQLEKLAEHYVDYGQPSRTTAQVVAEFKRRLRAIPADTPLPATRRSLSKPKAA